MSVVVETVPYWAGPKDGTKEDVALALPEGYRIPVPGHPDGCYILTSYAEFAPCGVHRRTLLWQAGGCMP